MPYGGAFAPVCPVILEIERDSVPGAEERDPMPDVWSMVDELDPAMRERLAEVLETRAAGPQQQAMRRSFLAEIAFPPRAHVLEVGCGTGC
jgi:hypothetical protein